MKTIKKFQNKKGRADFKENYLFQSLRIVKLLKKKRPQSENLFLKSKTILS